MTPEERWVAAEDVAAHLGVAKDSVYRWIDERGLPAHRVGRLLRFKLSEIEEWVRQDSQQASGGNPSRKPTSPKGIKNKSGFKNRSRKKATNG